MPRKPKKKQPKKCRKCRKPFYPSRPMQAVCDFHCAIEEAKDKRKKKEAKEAKQAKKKKAAIKTKAKWLQEAQTEFNRYIRARDQGKPCISCGRPDNGKTRHASHYKSVGSNSYLRFNTYNVHASCIYCNVYKSGNLIGYREGLISKIGEDKVVEIESSPRTASFSIEYAKRIKRIFRNRARLTIARKLQ